MSHRIVVLISGSGTNLQAIIDAIRAGHLDAEVALVLSNRSDAAGLHRAEKAGIETVCLDHKGYASREAYDQAMIDHIDPLAPDTVVLAGFMRILSSHFVKHYAGRLINIHPSLLPKYRGLNTHARVLEAGDSEHGCSIHFVTEELDGGPLIARAPVAVKENDTEESLSKRVQQREHQLYPLVLQWRSEQRLQLTDKGVELDGKVLPKTGYLLA